MAHLIEAPEAQERLRLSQACFDTLVQQASDGIFISTPEGHYLDVNNAGCGMLGYTREEILARSIADLVIPEETSRIAAETGKLQHGTAIRSEWQMRRKDGSLFACTVSGIRLPDGRLLGIVRDNTERRRTLEALSASEALLRQFIRHTPAAVAMFDREVCYLQASDRWLTDYRLGNQTIIGRSHYDVFPDIPEHWKEVHRRVLAGAVERCDEDPFERADGGIEWLQWEVRPWRQADGSVGGIIMFTQVITERKRIEQKIAEQLEELQRWYHLTLGREDRLLQLKREVNELCQRLGQPPRYPTAADNPPAAPATGVPRE